MNVTVLGAGSWGTALSIMLARKGHEVTLWGRDPEEIGSMRSTRENMHYLPGFALPEGLTPTHEIPGNGADMWVIAVPSGAVRSVASCIVGEAPLVVIASKGLESGSAKRMQEVVLEVLPNADESKVGIISGPNLAVEIVRGIPTAALAAFRCETTCEVVRNAFNGPTFRVYNSADVIGVELAGSLKNVLAIAAGMSDGLGFGDNSKGALLARGLKEMILLGRSLGARAETFLGIAGVGDLFATASSKLSRNYRVGRAMGEGRSVSSALSEIGQVAEGLSTAEATMMLARRQQVPMPIFEAIESVIRGRVRPADSVSLLMDRNTKDEGLWLS